MGLAGCGSSFTGPRVLEPCNGTWPVCGQLVGCILGPESYVKGKLPVKSRFIVQVFEPSTVEMHFLLTNAVASGTNTTLNWFENGCRSRVQDVITGNTFVGESQQLGEFVRGADLADIGDHLIEFESDGRADYLFKVDVLPKRVQ